MEDLLHCVNQISEFGKDAVDIPVDIPVDDNEENENPDVPDDMQEDVNPANTLPVSGQYRTTAEEHKKTLLQIKASLRQIDVVPEDVSVRSLQEPKGGAKRRSTDIKGFVRGQPKPPTPLSPCENVKNEATYAPQSNSANLNADASPEVAGLENLSLLGNDKTQDSEKSKKKQNKKRTNVAMASIRTLSDEWRPLPESSFSVNASDFPPLK